jgi:hypothetical protein
MTATTRKLILTALAVLATGSALADPMPVFSGRYIGPVAELSAEERARFRDRWQQLPAEEREAMRRKLRQDWEAMPPEARQQQRRELMNKLEERRDRRGQSSQDDYEAGYGQGYGTRLPDGMDFGDRGRGRR